VFAGRCETGFAGSNLPLEQSEFAWSKLVALDPASLVGVKLASLLAVDLASRGASW